MKPFEENENVFENKLILVFSEPFVKLLATVKRNVSSLAITGIRLQLSRISRQIGRGIMSYDSYACLVLVESYYNSCLKRTTRRITTTARTIMDNNNCESINNVLKKNVYWTPQPIPKLTTKLLNVIRIQHVDLNKGNKKITELRTILPRNLTRTNDLEPIVHSQDIRTFFFHLSPHYVFRTIT